MRWLRRALHPGHVVEVASQVAIVASGTGVSGVVMRPDAVGCGTRGVSRQAGSRAAIR